MLKELISIFRSGSLMERAYEISFDMLDKTKAMYDEAKDVLRNTEHSGLSFDVSDEDNLINKYQREVRKDVFSHLTMAGTDELSSGLALVSIVIDLERIGDFAKNIVEIAGNYEPKLHGSSYENDLQSIEKAVDDVFQKTIVAFKEADEDIARAMLKEYKWVPKTCDKMLASLIKGEDTELSPSSAVAMAVYIRALKRIFAHLRNVTTSVVNPFHRIGFKPKKKKNK
jgi:phosphate uptake regulator